MPPFLMNVSKCLMTYLSLQTSSAAEVPLSMPPLVSPLAGGLPHSVPPLMAAGDPLLYQQFLLQQEYLKQTFLFR